MGLYGTLACVAPAPSGGPRRLIEFDRHGTPHAVLRWSPAALEAAWIRIPDRSWLRVEPRATQEAPWGWSDRLWAAPAPGSAGTEATVFDALDWTHIDRIPTLAEPARLPRGGGGAVLNLIATLAADQGRAGVAYRGPYPTEQLFSALLESFLYHPPVRDPLAAFVAGELVWRPAPHERVFTPAGACVQLRGRVEKVVWEGRTYLRPDWQGVALASPHRVRDEGEGVRCSLWALGGVLEDHLALDRAGEVLGPCTPAAQSPDVRPIASEVASGIVAVVAARSAPALRPLVRAAGARLALEWGPLARDLADVRRAPARVSNLLRAALAERLRGAVPAERPGVGLAALAEIAGAVGDALRARAQERAAALSPEAQEALLSGPPASDPADARAITDAVAALLADLVR